MKTETEDKKHIIKNALTEIKRLKKIVQEQSNGVTEPIAVIGMACRFPGGINSPGQYWDALLSQKNMISEIPEGRWKEYTREQINNNPYLKKAGFLLEDINAFDHRLFRLSPREVERMDPQQKLFLKVCWEALENAGYAPDKLKGTNTGVYAGVSALDHIQKTFINSNNSVPEPGDVTGSSFSFLSGRTSYFFGFHGPGITLDTACSSSLVSVDQACKGLLLGDCDMAVAGGVNLMLSPKTTELLAELNILSPDCEIRTFDAKANGTVRGEGCGIVILKKLSRAQIDGDYIHAVIKGSGTNQDGLSSGLTAPYGPAQEKLIQNVWKKSKTDSSEIDFIETHGTGTELGDPIEVAALGNIINKQRENPVYIGAVKTSIGHLEAASGIAAFIKTVLSVENGKIPGNLNFKTPSPHINWDELSIKVTKKNINWEKEKGNRKAAISSFGLSGTNAHVVIEEYKREKKQLQHGQKLNDKEKKWPFRFSAISAKGLKNQLACFAEYLKQQVNISISNLSYSQNISRVQQEYKMVIWAKDRNELIKNISLALDQKTNADIKFGTSGKKVVFLFSGSGSQYPGMFKELYTENLIFKKYLDQCNNAYKYFTGKELLPVIFSNTDEIHEIRYTQVALFAVEYALGKTWIEYGVEPAFMLGHSAGEYAAACLAGVFSLNDAIKLITSRGELIHTLPGNGKMLAVSAKKETVKQKIQNYKTISIAATNTPQQTVISGINNEIEQLSKTFFKEGIDNKPLHVNHAFHNPLLTPMLKPFEAISQKVKYSKPSKNIISNVTGEIIIEEIATYQYWSKHILAPVKFMESILSIKNIRDYIFLEIGPKGILTPMVEAISHIKTDCLISNSNEKKTSTQIEKCLFHISNSGININWKKYYQQAGHQKIFVPNYQFNENHIALDSYSLVNNIAHDMKWEDFYDKINLALLNDEEKKHLPSIYKAIQNSFQKHNEKNNQDENFSFSLKSSYSLETLEQATKYVKTSFLKEWKMNEEFSNDENLLLCGLDSIILARIITRWKEDLSIHLKPAPFLKNPSIKGWAEIIFQNLQTKQEKITHNIQFIQDKENRYEPFNFNDVQNAYYVGRNTEIEWGGFSCYGYMEIKSKNLNPEKFQKALNTLIQRHEMLRCIITGDGKQKILPQLNYEIPIYTKASVKNINEHLEVIRKKMSSQTFPAGNPMFEIKLTEITSENWYIHFGLDFIISDALSISIFWNDLFKIYKGETLPQLDVSFRDYIQYSNAKIEGVQYQSDKNYWLKRIEKLPEAPRLPVKTNKFSFNGFRRREKWFNKQNWNKFVKSAAKQKLTPSAALLTIFSEILSAWGAGRHFGIILTVFERDHVHPQVNDIIGDFTRLSLLEINREQQNIAKNAQKIQWQMQEDLEHASYSIIDLVKKINKNRDTSNIFYPVVFTSALGVSDKHVGFGNKDLFGETGYMISQTPQVWLDSQVIVKNGGVSVSWDTLEQIFPGGMLDEMFQKYLELIDMAINDETFWEITPFDLRTKKQIQIHKNVNQTKLKYQKQLLHDAILKSANKNVHKTAIIYNGEKYTYSQLQQRANQLTQLMQSSGLKKGDLVAVQMERSFNAIAVILGITQAGAAYIPLNYNNPVDRTIDIIKKSNTKFLFSDKTNEIPENAGVKKLSIKQADSLDGSYKKPLIKYNDTAYVIYTSGSTGNPKGVVISHEAAQNTILDINSRFKITQDDSILGISSLSFDLSVYDIFGILGLGGKLILTTEQERIDPKSWRELSNKNKVSLWNTVPVLLELYVDYILNNPGGDKDQNIKNIFLSGDWIPLNIHQKIKKAIPNAKLISMGGATEASIWSNYYEVETIQENWKSIPYGFPLANQSFYILDEFGRPCPDWVKGKLHIAGEGLAKEYLNEKELTDKAFYIHPELKIRLYDTGDYGRYTVAGEIEFLGREDEQLKINGYRVEIGEIQEAFRKCNKKLNAIILPVGEQMGNKKLIAFIKQDPANFSEEQLKIQLSKYIPSYFIPEKIIAFNEFPKTGNGKIDRKKLIQSYYKQVENKITPSQNIDIQETHPVLETVRNVFKLPNLKQNDDFSAFGISSMDIIRLANQLESDFSDRPAVGNMIKYHSANDLILYYNNKGLQFEQNKTKHRQIDSKYIFYTKEQINYLEQLELIEDYDDRLAYKQQNTSCRNNLEILNNLSIKEKNSSIDQNQFLWRKSYREYLSTQIPFSEFKKYLGLCSQYIINGKKQYNYGSAGGTYPVQIYLSVFNNRVEKLEEGTYYFNPENGELLQLSAEKMIEPDKLVFNHQWLSNSSFVIHLVADMEVIYPIYEQRALKYCFIESGLICQMLETEGAQFNIGSCQLGAYDFDKIKHLFQLSDKHFYLHSIVAGSVNFKNEKQKTLLAIQAENAEWKKEERTLDKLVEKNKKQEIHLFIKDKTLKYKAPEGVMNKELLVELKKYKHLLIPYLIDKENQKLKKKTNPLLEPFDLTPIQWAFVTGRANDFELGNTGAHYYTEIECQTKNILEFEQALNLVIKNHEALKTIILNNGTQKIQEETPYYKVTENNIKHNSQIQQIRNTWTHHKYELGKWPMFHFEISHMENKRSVIHISIDLLLIDAWSGDLMLSEIFKILNGHPVQKPQITFKNYIKKEKNWYKENKYFVQKAEKYWKEKLKNTPPAPALPYVKALSEIERPWYKRWKFEISVNSMDILSSRAKSYNLTSTAVICTVFMKILSIWSNNKNHTLNLTLFNRLPLHKDVMQVLGDFTNVAPVSYFTNKHKNFLSEAEDVQNQIWQIIEHRAKNGLEILRELGKNTPYKAVLPIVFTSLLSGESSDVHDSIFPPDIKEVYAISQTPQVAIDHQVYRRGGNYLLNWDVVEEAFDSKQVETMFQLYRHFLNVLINKKNWDIQLKP